MDCEAYVGALRREAEALASAAAGGDLGAPVPSCPGWALEDLVRHVGGVHHFWREIVQRQLTDPGLAAPAPTPDRSQLLAWFRREAEDLAGVLAAADPRMGVWTWSSRQDVAFVQRRMALETAVHRWDAQAAGGDPRPIEAHLAADGVDEFLEVMLPGRPTHLTGPRDRVHLHATNATVGHSGEWVIEVGEGSVGVTRGHGRGDVAVRAPLSDLLLLLWRRIPPSRTEVLGDPSCLQRFLARTDLT